MAALTLVWVPAASPEARPSESAGTSLLSREGEPPGTIGRGYAPAISADGRFVAFWDGSVLLVRDLGAGRTVVASLGSDGVEDRQPGRTFGPPSISGDGRFVAFDSTGSLVPGDGDEADVFVRDLVSGTTTLASRASGVDGAAGNHASREPSISDDGRFVAFSSSASNLVADDAETGPPDPSGGIDQGLDVFVRDLQIGTTTLISRASGPAGADGNGASTSPSISGDGRFVAFRSLARNLDRDDDDAADDIYVRDLQTATTIFVGRGPASSRRRGVLEEVGPPSISADGQSVAFSTSVHFDVEPIEYWQDELFVRNLQRRTTTLVSVASTGAAASGVSPSLSSDGRYVAFSSGSRNLQLYRTAPFPNIFIRDLKRRRTVLVSRAADAAGTPGNGGSHYPSVSADGRFVVFESRSSNLHPADHDRSGDIFLRDLGPPPPRAPAPAACGGRRATTIMLTGEFSFSGTDGPDVVVGSRERDSITGGPGRDRLCGRRGRDRLGGGPGRDQLSAGTGADIVRGSDNAADILDCGPGRDQAVVDSRDRVRRCERIRIREPRR